MTTEAIKTPQVDPASEPPQQPPIAAPPVPGDAPIIAPPAAPEVPGLEDADRSDGVAPHEHHVEVPRSAFARIKDRAAGRERASILTTLGVDSIDAAAEIIRKSKEPQMTTPAAPAVPIVPPVAEPVVPAQPAAAVVPPVDDRAVPETTRRHYRSQIEEAQRVAAEATTRATQAEAARIAAETAHAAEVTRVREEALVTNALTAAGVDDVEYVKVLHDRHVATLDEAAKKAFDRAAWAADLKKTKPVLFKAREEPAKTGVEQPGGGAPGAPQPGKVENPGAPPAPNALEETDEQRRTRYRGTGIVIPPGSTHRPRK